MASLTPCEELETHTGCEPKSIISSPRREGLPLRGLQGCRRGWEQSGDHVDRADQCPELAAQPNAGNTNGHRATGKQIEYIARLAGQINGMDPRRLEALAGKMFDKPLCELNSFEASGLINTLKSVKAGEMDLDKILARAAT